MSQITRLLKQMLLQVMIDLQATGELPATPVRPVG
jgi:hypothetical protein